MAAALAGVRVEADAPPSPWSTLVFFSIAYTILCSVRVFLARFGSWALENLAPWAILPVSFAIVIAFGTFLLRQFMLTIPPSLDEAAQIDGASHWQTFWNVILPLARPGLITLGIFTFLGNYRSFFWPLILIKSEHLRTLPIGMLYFDTVYGRQTNLIMAASVMNIIPLIILFVAAQRHIVKGVQLGAVKG